MKGVVSVGQKQRFSTLEIIRNWLVAFTRGFADSLRGAIELFLLDYRYWMRTCFVGELNHNWRFCRIFVDQVAEVNLKAVELVLPSFDMEEYKYYHTLEWPFLLAVRILRIWPAVHSHWFYLFVHPLYMG